MAIVAAANGTPGYVAVSVDDTDYETLLGWINRGYILQRVTDEEAKRGFGEFLDWQIAKRKTA